MDILTAPRPDEDLCSYTRRGDLSNMQHAIYELETAGNPVTLSRAMIICIATRNINALKLLLEHAQVDEAVAEEAAQTESNEIVQAILDYGWPIDRSLRGGSVPSILSFSVQNCDFLEWLLSKGADPNATSLLNETALSFAVREGTTKAIDKLVAAGTDVSRGHLLHCASQREQSDDTPKIINMLIQQGARVDTYEYEDTNERASVLRYGFKLGTALHTACKKKNRWAADALLEHGADPYRLKKQGERFVPPTPMDLADPPMRSLPERHIAVRQSEGVS